MKPLLVIFTSLCLLFPSLSQARDTKHMLSIADAMQSAEFQEKLDSSIKLYFGDQAYSKVVSEAGNYTTNKKTNAVGKSDERACNWVFLSALLALQERAKAEGANAVVNISSYYKKNKVSSSTEFECHAGAIMAGVALNADVVTLK